MHIRKGFGIGMRLPAALLLERTVRCRLQTASPIAGLADELIYGALTEDYDGAATARILLPKGKSLGALRAANYRIVA